MIFNVLALASSLEGEFPHRAEYWWTLLPGTLDQACTCLSMQKWVDELKTCETEESFLTTYQSFLDTTWEAVENRVPTSDTFLPYVKPTPQELSVAYYMKNRALILHNRIVWGPDADKDNPRTHSKQSESKSKPSQEGASAGDDIIDASAPPEGGNGDDEDPNRKKPDDASQRKGDESQDPEKKKEEKEASIDKPQSSAEKEAQDKIDELMQKLQEAKDAKAKAEKEAREAVQRAAEEKARKTGDELIKEVEAEKAAEKRKREASKEKKAKKKEKKTSQEDEGKSEPSEGEEDKPEGGKSKDKKSEKDEPPKDESKEEGKDKEGPIKDEEPAEPWIEVVRRAAKPRQNISKAAEKARARTYPRPMCEETAHIDYVYTPQHVPTRELFTSGRWSVVEKQRISLLQGILCDLRIILIRPFMSMESEEDLRTTKSVCFRCWRPVNRLHHRVHLLHWMDLTRTGYGPLFS